MIYGATPARVNWLQNLQLRRRYSFGATAAEATTTAPDGEETTDDEPVAAYVHLPFCKVSQAPQALPAPSGQGPRKPTHCGTLLSAYLGPPLQRKCSYCDFPVIAVGRDLAQAPHTQASSSG